MNSRTDKEIIDSLTARNLELSIKLEQSQSKLLQLMGKIQLKEQTLGKVHK